MLRPTDKPVLLDAFCGAGGATRGYQLAGFYVVGVDNKPQPHYCGDEFYQGDALDYIAQHGSEFDAIHASPPCQAYSRVSGRARKAGRKSYPDLVEPVRDLLFRTGKPFAIENVQEAPLVDPVILCGSSFGLDVRRHRGFESNVALEALPCQHHTQAPRFRPLNSQRKGKLSCVVGVHGHINYCGEFDLRCKAMGIDWMLNSELVEAIPPAYTEFIGKQLLAHLKGGKAHA